MSKETSPKSAATRGTTLRATTTTMFGPVPVADVERRLFDKMIRGEMS